MPHQRIKKGLLFLGDAAMLYAALFIILAMRGYAGEDPVLIQRHFMPFTSLFILWLLALGASGLYDLRFMKNSRVFLYRLIRAMGANTIIAVVIFYFLPILTIEPRRNLLAIVALATVLIFLWRYIFNLLVVRTPSARLLLFGVNPETMNFVDYLLKNPQLGQRPVAFISPEDTITTATLPLPHLLLKNHNLAHIIFDTQANLIIISHEIRANKELVKVLFQAIPLGIGTADFSAFHEMLLGKIPISLIGEVWFLENLIGIKKRFYEFAKRAIDIAVAIMLGIPALLLLPLTAAAIRLDSVGPVFYRQKRMGRGGEEFSLVKYRTMIKDADKMSGFKKEEGFDPRHTRVGRLLRKSYLDELPQIINILKGEMSFVGPRPERPGYVTELKQKILFYEMRLLVPPGITGWAQINMENDASVEDAPEKMQYDLYYIKNRSFILDLLIILRTVFILLRREGR